MKASDDVLVGSHARRKNDYFYIGFRGNFWWWEVLVKRMGVLGVPLVAYAPIFQDAEPSSFDTRRSPQHGHCVITKLLSKAPVALCLWSLRHHQLS